MIDLRIYGRSIGLPCLILTTDTSQHRYLCRTFGEQRDERFDHPCSPHGARKRNVDAKYDDGMGMPLHGGGCVERNSGGGATNPEMSNNDRLQRFKLSNFRVPGGGDGTCINNSSSSAWTMFGLTT